ncbi:PHF7 protein, partial [Galbula dea]|nr:PHF7 protein [Galbula dea]
CFICHQSGATITCREIGCEHNFHLPCAKKGGCITQYFGLYSSFCSDHCPQQTVKSAPEDKTECLICLELVEDSISYRNMVCPACEHAWFHRDCIQGQALSAGSACFLCPLCRDRDLFQAEMLRMGIRIPQRPPSWETAALFERHRRCDARECLFPGGREQAEEEGPWRLLLCSSCAAEGTHRQCSQLSHTTNNWECDRC